jgi:GH35 family endo-1,4-beta-xylanase
MILSIGRGLALGMVFIAAPAALGQTTVNGDSLVHRSTGSSGGGSNWTIDRNGYVGTYIMLDAPGSVTIDVNASGTASGGVNPHMNIVLADTKASFEVPSGFNSYQHTFDLPAGMHFLRTEFNNDLEASSRSLTIQDVTVTGATVSIETSNGDALAAADTYIANYRQGPARVAVVGVAPGTEVGVKLKRHEFNFGTTVPNSFTDTLLINNPTPGSDAANYQQALVDNRFNSLSAENGGKWSSNEGTRDVLTANAVNPNGGPNIPYIDRISDYAMENDIRYRAHNLIWGPNNSGNNNQQPNWAHTMLQNPTATDAVSGDLNSVALRDEISERIDYYVRDRADRFYEIDVYNESYHTGSNHSNPAITYWEQYGASGIAEIYKEVKAAVAAAGAEAGIFVNEYSVVQQQGNDYFANWYLRHTESIQNAGRVLYGADEDVVTGIGYQYYAGTNLNNHVAARIYATMHNLAVLGLPIALTEWGVTGTDNATNEATAAIILDETTRLVFGMPGTTGITLWNLRNTPGTFAPVGTLYDANWTPRDTEAAWQALMNEWDTDLTATVNPDGTIDFSGFYGDYEITIDGQTYDLTLDKGTAAYSLVVAPGDYNGDGTADAADYTLWRDTLDSQNDLRADGNGNLMIDSGDYDVWLANFGANYASGGGSLSTAVPEPAAWLLALLAAGWFGRVRCRFPCDSPRRQFQPFDCIRENNR